LESLHYHGYIHRDIKPDNFMVGVDNKIYLIDFGLAQSFRNPTNNHISFTKGHSLVGTIRYTSINSHLGHQQSRRDDLESFAYTIVYLLFGKLPWQNISLPRKANRAAAILRKKKEFPSDITPSSLATFLHYSLHLSFEEEPNYTHLHALLQQLLT